MAPPENGRALLKDLGSRGKLIELEGVGHSLNIEAPDEVGQVVVDYLKSR
jgi:pimeloyl-ACP methyl ester carboxylesterase